LPFNVDHIFGEIQLAVCAGLDSKREKQNYYSDFKEF